MAVDLTQVPNFDAMASGVLDELKLSVEKPFQHNDRHALLVRHLRRVWYARGQADILTLEREYSFSMGTTALAQFIDKVKTMLRPLDQ